MLGCSSLPSGGLPGASFVASLSSPRDATLRRATPRTARRVVVKIGEHPDDRLSRERPQPASVSSSFFGAPHSLCPHQAPGGAPAGTTEM
mmetsp:Transcript_3860/g.15317  ORF Transcript_3860/g.15317 Transcript_3860/m.15317 type:complete len:90 (+) Transcript_3860:1335-1604(+)